MSGLPYTICLPARKCRLVTEAATVGGERRRQVYLNLQFHSLRFSLQTSWIEGGRLATVSLALLPAGRPSERASNVKASSTSWRARSLSFSLSLTFARSMMAF